ncbi:hypothetical protein GGI43DRAFT_411839 [Trichoderma evansii]
MGEQTGPRILHYLWSYVTESRSSALYKHGVLQLRSSMKRFYYYGDLIHVVLLRITLAAEKRNISKIFFPLPNIVGSGLSSI